MMELYFKIRVWEEIIGGIVVAAIILTTIIVLLWLQWRGRH